VLIAGFGGQGILLVGQILADAAMKAGFHTTWFPSYGPEMRGGTANCTTIFSDEEIGSPIASTYDILIAMNQPSLERFAPSVRPGGAVLVNASMVPIRCEREGVTALHIPAADLARAAGSERVANMLMLGAVLSVQNDLRQEWLERAVAAVVGRKHAELIEANLAAIRAGARFRELTRQPEPAPAGRSPILAAG
jgi:2-oxoglutarate ferredoxin oxidoreductase subunit gamma